MKLDPELVRQALDGQARRRQISMLPAFREVNRATSKAFGCLERAARGDPGGWSDFLESCRHPYVRARAIASALHARDASDFVERMRAQRDVLASGPADYLHAAELDPETGALYPVTPIRRNRSALDCWSPAILDLLRRGERISRIARAIAPLACVDVETARGWVHALRGSPCR